MFDSYCIPMGESPRLKRYHSPEEIKGYVHEVEKAFGLPPGGISHKRVARKKRTEGSVSIVEVRKAAVFYLLENTLTPKRQISPAFGIQREQLYESLNSARDHKDANDEIFMYYYRIVSSIEI